MDGYRLQVETQMATEAAMDDHRLQVETQMVTEAAMDDYRLQVEMATEAAMDGCEIPIDVDSGEGTVGTSESATSACKEATPSPIPAVRVRVRMSYTLEHHILFCELSLIAARS